MARPSQPSLVSAATGAAALDDERAPGAARAERRKQIIDAAKAVFAEAGYHGASIGDIIDKAGIARGTFYLYFHSKAAIFDSILDQATADLRRLVHRIEVEDPKAPPPQAQLRDQLVGTLAYIVGDRALATLLLSAGHTPEAEAAQRLDQFYADVHALLVRALDTGMAIGLLRRCDREVTASALLGLVRGVIEMMIRAPTPPRVEDVVGELVVLALRGVMA